MRDTYQPLEQPSEATWERQRLVLAGPLATPQLMAAQGQVAHSDHFFTQWDNIRKLSDL